MIETLEKMLKKPFLFRNEEVVVLNYCQGTGDDGDEVEIYLNNGKTLVYNYANLDSKLAQFKPVTTTVVVLAQKMASSVSTMNPSVVSELRDIVLDQIRNVKDNPEAVNQAKQVFQGVNTMLNMAKVQMEHIKMMQAMEDRAV